MPKKTFTQFIKEAATKTKPVKPHRAADLFARQKAERIALKKQQTALKLKHDGDLEKARESDFRNAQSERDKARRARADELRAKKTTSEAVEEVSEVLEVGTDEIVAAYAEKVPHSIKKQ